MDKIHLEKLISLGFSTRKIAKELNKSQASIKYWLLKFNLKTQKTFNELCKICGSKKEKIYSNKRSICVDCINKESVKRFQNNKKQQVEYKGGKCEKCGYDKCMAALAFHHLDPKEKDPNWNIMKSRKLDTI